MNPTEMSAVELANAYATGELSPVEATAAVLDRIEEDDGELGAFCLVDREAALGQARASEDRWRSGYPAGLLDGVPVSIKDIYAVPGLPTYAGSSRRLPQAWEQPGPMVAALLAQQIIQHRRMGLFALGEHFLIFFTSHRAC